MAYPNPIKTTGALSQTNDIFEYFKGALVDLSNNPESWAYWTDDFIWDYFIESYFAPHSGNGNPIAFPMTRQQFYDWIDYWTITTSSSDALVRNTGNMFRTIHGTKLYQFIEPEGNINWPVEAVNHWGKIKTLELAIFGNVGNGGDLSANSLFTSGTVVSRVPEFKICSLSYLRYGLTRFDSYGSCHPPYVEGPSLNLVYESVSNREIVFDIPSGIFIGDCEVSLDYGDNFSSFTTGYGHPTYYYPVPSGRKEIGQIVIRVRRNRGAYVEAGPEIYNLNIYP